MTVSSEKELFGTATDWRLLGLLFECPSAATLTELKSLGGETTNKTLRQAAVYAQTEADEGLYHLVFGPGGPAPPREVSYRSWVQPGYLLSELSSYYRAFEYRPRYSDVPDHIAVEAGFVGYLRLKEAYCLLCDDHENAAIAGEAADRFTKEHIAEIASPLSKLLAGSGVKYMMLAGEALFEMSGAAALPERKEMPVFETGCEEFGCGSEAFV